MLQSTVHAAATDEELQDAAAMLSIFVEDGQEQFITEFMKSEKALTKLPKTELFPDI